MSRECCGPDEPLARRTAPETGEADEKGAAASPEEDSDEPAPFWRDGALLLPALAGVLLGAGYLLTLTGAEIAATVAHAASLLAGAATFVPGAVRRLLQGGLGVGLLMTIAAVGAVLLGRIGEAAALAFLFSIAEALEDRAMDKARHGLRALLSLIPETARLSKLSGDVIVPASRVEQFDLLVVLPGERIPTDGVVVSGRSSVDTSAVTGESIPVEVAPGDPVPAGSINGGGALQVEATAGGRDNSLTTIVRLVEEAQSRRGERARLADRIARPLVPVVLAVAGLIVLGGFLAGDPATWTERALVVLVAASPCALAIAVPVTVVSAIGAASRFGVIIKSGEAFEQLGTIRRVAFDKTGTLTRNRPQVVAVEVLGGRDRDQVLAAAAAVEARSTHPLASAIVAAAPRAAAAAGVVEEPGRGVTGTVQGARVTVGSTRRLDPGPLGGAAERMERQGMTVVLVDIDGSVVGAIGIRDELKPEAAEAVRQLQAAGISTVMLTGDNGRTAAALAAQVGIADVRAEQLPQDKAAVVEALSAAAPTAMIGDGVNDAPALAAATVGIAMGATGSAAAVESADVAVTGTDLRLIPQALAHARRGRRIMTGNIGLSLAIIVVLFPLALTGVLGLAGVVLAHEIAEVVVIANGLRAAQGRRALPPLQSAPRTAVA